MSENVEISGAPERPAFLTVLCVLSFIFSGIYIILFLIVGMAMGSTGLSGKGFVDNIMELAKEQNPDIVNTPNIAETTASLEILFTWPYIITATILTLASLFGVVKMWKLKKLGFFLYSGVGILGLIVPMLFGLPFGMGAAVVTFVFIALYYMNTKVMS